MLDRSLWRAQRRLKLTVAAGAAFALLGGLFAAQRLPVGAAGSGEVAGTVTGSAFRDYDADGRRDELEPGEAGIVVRAFDSSGALVGEPASSTANGNAVQLGLHRCSLG